MKLEKYQVIQKKPSAMRYDKYLLLERLAEELKINENKLDSLLDRHKAVILETRDGYFPLRCRMVMSEVLEEEFVKVDDIVKYGGPFIVYTGLSHISLSLLKNY